MAKAKSKQNVFVWIMIGFLILGLAGFGIDGFLGGQVRSIGQVGGRDISANAYMRALQNEMRAIEQQTGQAFPFTRAREVGLDATVRARLVSNAALEAEAARIGISVGDETIGDTLRQIQAFHGPRGSFDRETYRFVLQNAGLTEAEFEADLRHEAARGILQMATIGGVQTPDNLRDALVDFYATRHGFVVFTLGEDALETPVPAPSEDAITAFYEANIDDFTAPETREITYVVLTPSMLVDDIEIDEDALRALYDSRIDDFMQPERRLVERLVYPDEAAAEAAMAELSAGASFEDLVAARGLDLEDTDMGDVSRAQLRDAGDAVFALEEPGSVTGPHPSPVGPALFRMNAVLAAQEISFEDAAEDLRPELAGDTARRAIADDVDLFDDLLAGGATLEELADETAFELGRIDWARGSSEGIAAHEEFRTAAAALGEDDFPELLTLENGGLIAMRLEGVTPPAPRPLAEVRAEAEAGARARAVAEALRALSETLAPQLAADGPEAFGAAQGVAAESYENITRTDRVPGVPASLLERIFTAAPGDPVMLVHEGNLALAMLTDRQAADTDDAQTGRLISVIDQQIGGALAEDVFAYFGRALEREAGISLNQAAIDAVHAALR